MIKKKNLPVNAHHRDFISPNDVNIIENFDILSTYHTKRYQMVEYMKHKDKSVYATQFHPETHGPNYFHPSLFDERISANARMVGEEIIHNFIWLCVYKKKESEKILAWSNHHMIYKHPIPTLFNIVKWFNDVNSKKFFRLALASLARMRTRPASVNHDIMTDFINISFP